MGILDDEDPLRRHDLRMLAMLARQPGWFDGLPEQTRRGLAAKLASQFAQAEMKPRELVAIARVFAQFERNDIERAKLMRGVIVEGDEDELKAVRDGDPGETEAEAQPERRARARTGAGRGRNNPAPRAPRPDVPARGRRRSRS